LIPHLFISFRQEVVVISVNAKNDVLKDALALCNPIYMTMSPAAGRIQTSKLFPKLKISEEEKVDPDEILEKFLVRSRPRVEHVKVEEQVEEVATSAIVSEFGDADDETENEESTPAPESEAETTDEEGKSRASEMSHHSQDAEEEVEKNDEAEKEVEKNDEAEKEVEKNDEAEEDGEEEEQDK
jgi:hypothetical protein